MEYKKDVSVIVPAYNASKTIDTCIQSILAQDYPHFELIIVDDCSTDSTLTQCMAYTTDARVMVQKNVKNSGVSFTRNYGMRCAQGTYILFVDADDTIKSNTLSSLMEKQAQENADVIIFGMIFDNTVTNYVIEKIPHLNPEDPFSWFSTSTMVANPVNKLFSKALIDRYTLAFPEDTGIGEDYVFCVSYLLHCQKIAAIPQCFYHYYINSNSSVYNESKRNDIFISLERVYALAKEHHLLDNRVFMKKLQVITKDHLCFALGCMRRCKKESFSYLYKEWVQEYKKISYLSIKERMRIFMIRNIIFITHHTGMEWIFTVRRKIRINLANRKNRRLQ